MQINRYKFPQKSIEKVLSKLKGNEVTGLPNWYKKLQNKQDLKVKNGKLFLGEKQIVPTEKVDEIMRVFPWKFGISSDFSILKFRGKTMLISSTPL